MNMERNNGCGSWLIPTVIGVTFVSILVCVGIARSWGDDERRQQIYESGRDAARHDVPDTANPHSGNVNDSPVWLNGWIQGRKEVYREREKEAAGKGK